ncbi:MAG: hypothetical protein GF308_17940 [Candidatus Heimdallarchaeota archaeon]|nr:hypothetical protein [Candidatus Heimdallarchaeota archaeon]
MGFVNFINIANLISGVIALSVSVTILQKNIKLLLNQLLGSGMLCWGLSLIFNAITFAFLKPAPGARIVRNLTTSLAVLSAFLIFSAALSMYKGEFFLKKWYILFPFLLILITNIVIVVIFDYTTWIDENDLSLGIKTTQAATWVLAFVYGMPILMIGIGLYYFIRTQMTVEEELIKKRIQFFIFGCASIIIGALIYALGAFLEVLFGFDQTFFEYLYWILAELFWIVGPVLMLSGFYFKKQQEKITPA